MTSFFQFQICFQFIEKNYEKCSNEQQGGNFDQSTVCYISMDLFQQALQTNGKLSSNLLSNYLPKTEKYSNKQGGLNIDQSAMFYVTGFVSTNSMN